MNNFGKKKLSTSLERECIDGFISRYKYTFNTNVLIENIEREAYYKIDNNASNDILIEELVNQFRITLKNVIKIEANEKITTDEISNMKKINIANSENVKNNTTKSTDTSIRPELVSALHELISNAPDAIEIDKCNNTKSTECTAVLDKIDQMLQQYYTHLKMHPDDSNKFTRGSIDAVVTLRSFIEKM